MHEEKIIRIRKEREWKDRLSKGISGPPKVTEDRSINRLFDNSRRT